MKISKKRRIVLAAGHGRSQGWRDIEGWRVPPLLKGYRTAILVTAGPYVWAGAVATGLAHNGCCYYCRIKFKKKFKNRSRHRLERKDHFNTFYHIEHKDPILTPLEEALSAGY